jgi:indolepyruvate ferredoxin oxidoreductase
VTDVRERTPTSTTTVTLSGVDALVRLLVLRHELDRRDGLTTATMVSGYPGSPLGGLDLAVEAAEAELTAHRVLHRPGLNEELAAATVWGSQMGAVVPYAGLDGVVGAWYGKTPGLDRSGDALKHGNAMGAGPNGGVVLFCGDDPTAKSSTLTCDSQPTFEDACIPVLVPADPQDVIDLGVHAFRLSRYCGAWVGLKVVTAVADGLGTVDLDPTRHPADEAPPDPLVDGQPWRHRPLTTIGPHAVPDQEALVVHHRLVAAQAYVRHHGLDRTIGAGPGASLGIVCAGTTYLAVVQALADLGVTIDALAGLGVRIVKLAMTYPLVEETMRDLAASVDRILVVEDKRPFVETQLRSLLHEAGSQVPVLGKRDGDGRPLVPSVGELDSSAIGRLLARVLPELASALPPAPATRLPLVAVPPRPPGFCSGCPHNRSTVVPEGALVGGGVGCHGIMYFEPRQADVLRLPPTPMGAEGVPWIGLAPFVDEPHLIQNLGDGTLSHSGTLAIRACVAAGVDVTFKILYNAAVAMTGGQEVTGLRDVPSVTRALEAEGVRRIVVCAEDPNHYGRHARWAPGVEVVGRDRLPEVQEALRAVPGVTVIVYDQRCAAEARRLRKRGLLELPPRQVFINEAVCEGCGDCSTKSNCLSVLPHDTELGEKRRIDDLTCNRDYTCLDGDCPSFVTLRPVRRRGGRQAVARTAVRATMPAGHLPVPTVPAVDGQFGIYFTGIGGTGVVTANRIVAAAASAAGLVVGGLDQTGLSQKAGAVVSHLHLASDNAALASATISARGADLYLSGDLLQAAGAAHLAKIDRGRTLAVVDVSLVPTTAMLQVHQRPPEVPELEAAIIDAASAERAVFLDSKHIAERAFANPLLANVVLLGAAFQRGGLPLSLADLEHAFARQGRAAADNRAAFEWGRWVVHDPGAVSAALVAADDGARPNPLEPSARAAAVASRLVGGVRLPAELRPLVTRRAAQVVDYQDGRRARRFLSLVERSAAADDAEHGWAFTRAVVEAWFKLLTYKDEYEVARLHLAVDYDRVAGDLGIEGSYALTYHLHPPFLRRLGLRRKLPMGATYQAGFHVLRSLRRVRGTPLDLFGRDPDRRTERAVIEEYESLVRGALAESPARPYDERVQLAASPMSIKGYGPIKEAAVARWREQVADPRAGTRPSG